MWADLVRDFRTLKVWQKSHELTRLIYTSSSRFPNSETYGLTSQIRRAAVSISANIAEGCGRGSDVDFARFAQMAMGSASEVEYLLILARDLEYLKVETYSALEENTIEVKRMLSAFIKKLRDADEIPHQRQSSLPMADS
jgi:four helix bundle protein